MALKCVFRLFCESNCSVCGAAFRLVNHFVLWECELSICHNQFVWIIKPKLWLIRLYIPIFYRFAPLVVIEHLVIRCSHLLWLSFHLAGLYGCPESRTRRDYSMTQLCLFSCYLPFLSRDFCPNNSFLYPGVKMCKAEWEVVSRISDSEQITCVNHMQYFCILSMNIPKIIYIYIIFLSMCVCIFTSCSHWKKCIFSFELMKDKLDYNFL